MDKPNIISINSVIYACCMQTISVMKCIGSVVDIDVFRVVHFSGAKQRIFNSVVQTLPFWFTKQFLNISVKTV